MAGRERSPSYYARIAGFIHLAAMAASIYAQGYLPDRIIAGGDAAATAQNLAALQTQFRAAIAVDVVVFASDVIIAWAYYELLKPVDAALARLGAFFRVAQAAILACVAVLGLFALRLASGPQYLQHVDAETLQGLTQLFLNVRGMGFYVGFVFLGAGSAVFAYVLLRSRFVPRVLPAWGMIASPLLALGALGALANAWFSEHLGMASMAPMFFYEVPLGLWFLIMGAKAPAAKAA